MGTELRNVVALRSVLSLALLIVTIVLTVYGIHEYKLLDQYLWTGGGRKDLWVLGFVSIAVSFITIKYFHDYFVIVAAFLLSLYVASYTGLEVVLSIFLYVLVSLGIGGWLFRRLMPANVNSADFYTPTYIVLKVGIGIAALISIVQLLVHFPINYRFVYLALVILPVCIFYKDIRYSINALFVYYKSDEKDKSLSNVLVSGLLFFTVMLQLAVACKPEVGHDALALHLWVPSYVYEHKMWHFDVSKSIPSLMPMAGDYSFVISYMLGGEFAAKISNFLLLMLVGVLLYESVKKSISSVLAKLVVAGYFSTPLLSLVTGSLFIENFWTFIFTVSIFLVVDKVIPFIAKWSFLVLLLSILMATKVMSVFVLPVFLVLFVIQSISEKIKLSAYWRFIVVGFVFFCVVGGWPYWEALIKTGNPVFPFMNHIFESSLYPAVRFSTFYPNVDYSQFNIFNLTFMSSKYLESQNGALGFIIFVFLFPSIVLMSKRYSRVAIVGAITSAFLILGVFMQQAYLRYIIPALPFASLLIGESFKSIINRRLILRSVSSLMFFVVILNIIFFSSSGWMHKDLVVTDFDSYVKANAPERLFVDYLNKYDEGARVAFIGRFYPTGLASGSVSNNWYFPDFSKRFRSSKNVEEMMLSLNGESIDYLIMTSAEIKTNSILADAITNHLSNVLVVNGYHLYKINNEGRWLKEILTNNAFESSLDQWDVIGNVKVVAAGAVVTNVDTLSQTVPALPGRRYKLVYEYMCDNALVVRMQVNWLNKNGSFIDSSIKTVLCDGGNQVFEAVVIAPYNVSKAVFYVGSHDRGEAIVTRVSMMQ